MAYLLFPRSLITTFLSLALIIPTTSAITSIATHYRGDLVGGNCMFSSYTLPPGIYGTAIAEPSWNSAALCGACLRVTGPSGNVIKAMVCLPLLHLT